MRASATLEARNKSTAPRALSHGVNAISRPSFVKRMDDAKPPVVEAKREDRVESGMGHDFSRIITHSPAVGAIQTKLSISQPGDVYEQEADRVAKQVICMPAPGLNKRWNGDMPHPLVQRRADSGSSRLTEAPPTVHEVLNSPGQPLVAETRAFLEPRFEHDFSHIRVHTDEQAAMTANRLNARAFTIGRDIVFGGGQYALGTDQGKRLLAHELTHTIQQQVGTAGLIVQRDVIDDVREKLSYSATDWAVTDADAIEALALLGTIPAASLANSLTRLGPEYVARLLDNLPDAAKTGEIYRRVLQTNSLLALRPAVPKASSVDQRVSPPGPAATVPGADLTRELGYELDPSSRPAPAPPVPAGPPGAPPPPPPARIPWDGRTGGPNYAAKRTKMQQELFKAYDGYLKHFRPMTIAAMARPRVAFNAPAAAPGGAAPAATGVVDIANQARAVLETRYATSMDAAAPGATLTAGRATRTTAPGSQNIFDPSSEADRSAFTGSPNLAPGVAWWLFENDVPGAAGAAGSRRFATEILAAHHYSTQDPGAEQFRWDVANAYAAASTLAPNNRRQLIDYRLTGWSERGASGITLLSSFDPGANRNRAELEQRWKIFKTATHESLHLRAHPAFVAAEQGRGTMTEGFVEMFAIATLNMDVLPRARAGSIEPLRRTVEGALSPATPDATLITNSVTPTQYAAHRAQAERIRDGGMPAGGTAHAGVGEAAVRAAFFQGHVEYLGLASTGSQLPALPAAGATPLTRVPGGITGLDDLAARSGVPRSRIIVDNPGITDSLPPAAVLVGCREHWVVAGETRTRIAVQHGVAEIDLVRANPDIPLDVVNQWPVLAAGQRILIPVH